MRQLTQREMGAVSGGRIIRLPQPMPDPGDYLHPFSESTTSTPAITIPLPHIPGPGHGDDGGDPEHPGGSNGGGGSGGGAHRIVCDDTGCNWV